MANLILTNACNLSCPFCFATETRTNDQKNCKVMNMEEFHQAMKFDNNILTNLCGGEPTTHPDFINILNDLLNVKGKYVNLLTNGVWSKEVRTFISKLPFQKSKRIVYLFNILRPELYTKNQLESLYESLSIVNPETTYIGFTIYKYPFDYSYIFDIAKRFGVSKIRYSIAAPNLMDPNSWNVNPETDFRPLAKVVYQFIKDANAQNFEVNPDCGYLPPCAYTKEELGELLLIKPSVKFNCTTVIDVAPGGQTWRCYGLYSVLKAKMDDFANIKEMTAYYDRRSKLLADIELFDDCKECEHKESGLCYGGCLTFHAIKALKKNNNQCLFLIDDDEALIKSIPVVNKRIFKKWKDAIGEDVYYIRKEMQLQTKTLELDKLHIEFIEACDGSVTVEDIITKLSSNYINLDEAKKEILAMVRYLFDLDVINVKSS